MKYYYVQLCSGYFSVRCTEFKDYGNVIRFYLNNVEIANVRKNMVEYISIIKLFSDPERVYEKNGGVKV